MEGIEALGIAAAAADPMRSTAPEEVVEGRVCHIDGDMLAYYCAGGNDTPAETARRALRNRIKNLTELSGSSSCRVHITARGSHKGYRMWLANQGDTPYQAQRVKHRPRNWEILRSIMEEHEGKRTGVPVSRWFDREADDGLATQAGNTELCVIATQDKDLRMVTGATHIDWLTFSLTRVPNGSFAVTGANGLLYGHKWFWAQMLQGDTVDNVSGLPAIGGKKVGEKTAIKLLANCHNNDQAFHQVAALYAAHYGEGWEHQFTINASLLWMRKSEGMFAFLTDLLLHPDWGVANTVPLKLVRAKCRELLDKFNTE